MADAFGTSLSLSSDATRLVVGAPFEGTQNVGAVYELTRPGATWTTGISRAPSTAESGAQFGTAISVSPDGSTLVVGTPGANMSAGAVSAF